MGSVGTISPFFKCWDTKKYRPLRIAVFVAMAFSSAVPVLHLFQINGLAESCAFFKTAGVSVLMYILGVFICKSPSYRAGPRFSLSMTNLTCPLISHLDAKRFPEKMYPGRFDFAGMTSHAIWHIFVCFGIYVSVIDPHSQALDECTHLLSFSSSTTWHPSNSIKTVTLTAVTCPIDLIYPQTTYPCHRRRCESNSSSSPLILLCSTFITTTPSSSGAATSVHIVRCPLDSLLVYHSRLASASASSLLIPIKNNLLIICILRSSLCLDALLSHISQIGIAY